MITHLLDNAGDITMKSIKIIPLIRIASHPI